jgi:hypothetical protein
MKFFTVNMILSVTARSDLRAFEFADRFAWRLFSLVFGQLQSCLRVRIFIDFSSWFYSLEN